MNPSSALATVLVDELVRGGVRDVVLAPGSRSAPLAYAALAAEAAGRVRLHVRVDERSAGFLALGLAKGSGRPVPVVTTSGTAVANLHPAVLEASHAGVPVVALSADRPHELRGTGANQTTAQPGLFGGATRFECDLPAPEAAPAAGAGWWRSTVCRALAAARGATGGAPGPVHLDLAFRDPLVPDGDDTLPEHLAGRPDGRPWVEVGRVTTRADGHGIAHVARTLVVVGDLPAGADAEDVHHWAADRGHPVVAEPFGPKTVRGSAVPCGSLLLTATDWVDDHAPDRVLVVGRPTLSRSVAALLRRPGLVVESVAGPGPWPDPGHVASRVHPWSALRPGGPHRIAEVHLETPERDPRAEFAQAWYDAGLAVADALAEAPAAWPSGLAVAAAVAEAVGREGVLVVGSSNPVRDLDLGVPEAVAGLVVANRGLAGIDGLVSTAAGMALGLGRPTHALVGDLTFLHDANGLLAGPDEPRPDLTVVVVNDDGGGIFTTLEPGEPERAETFERVFGTPTGTDLAALCRAHAVPHTLAGSREELVRLVGEPPAGLSVVEVRVDRGTHRQAHADLRALAAAALRS
ncbi:2-succinyl-5-enolpyruvyl-6-hydroxy-3-cyclohexene-1-carboxylic-acid synthase [Phycicoccus sp. CSK15P-2]|uniref:2-succinyl-5-enolpyruvyl-6-hydroxy-3- cyclohexene-1-carboxylic-acid synthase n=1 Tax=Phycicoccus sp. CSK15P-2 TaxID=2807627 RepID=UPI0027DB28BD|nr:2-succinyl-5-enolpyruvyl-6-hydroxy-3-cyclohexene-1-carboxylic-acid synthase [Phycicoccus sp. CSK15P-2]